MLLLSPAAAASPAAPHPAVLLPRGSTAPTYSEAAASPDAQAGAFALKLAGAHAAGAAAAVGGCLVAPRCRPCPAAAAVSGCPPLTLLLLAAHSSLISQSLLSVLDS